MSAAEIKLPLPAKELVPHRDSMLLLQTLDGYTEESANARILVKDELLFIKNSGQIDPVVYVEFLAQLVAAHSGYTAKLDGGSVKTGFLVGIKDFHIKSTVKAGDELHLSIKKDYSFDQISYLTGEVKKGNDIIGSGTLKLWEHNEDDPVLPDNSRNEPTEPMVKREWQELADQMFLNEQILKYIVSIKEYDQQFITEISFGNGFIGFKGHFPGMPILPGVIMLKTGLLLGEVITKHSLLPVNIKQAKFAKSILPNEKIKVSSTFQSNRDAIRLSTVIIKNQETCAKFSIDCIKH